LQYTFQISQNGGHYFFVTNDFFMTGLAPFYIKAYFDANGDGVFDTGDPYVNLGLLTPTTDGLLQNISFGDTNIK
jgi:hypothetical protein